MTGGVKLSAAAPKGFRSKVSQMLAGLQTVIPDGSSVTVGGVAVAKADLVAEMTQVIAGYQAIDAAEMAVKGARLKQSGQLPGFRQQFVGLKDALVASFGRGNPQLAQFGVAVSSGSKPLTPAQKVVKAAKAAKTRLMRHTMGKRQKATVQYTGSLEVAVNETASASAPANGTAATGAPHAE
jgi:hypothetical protein